MKKVILAPFRSLAWLIREILAYILRNFFGCMVVYPKKSKYTLKTKSIKKREGKNGK